MRIGPSLLITLLPGISCVACRQLNADIEKEKKRKIDALTRQLTQIKQMSQLCEKVRTVARWCHCRDRTVAAFFRADAPRLQQDAERRPGKSILWTWTHGLGHMDLGTTEPQYPLLRSLLVARNAVLL